MHSGKMYESGKADAYKECFKMIGVVLKDKEDFIKHVNTDGQTIEYCPDYVLKALAAAIMTKIPDEQ